MKLLIALLLLAAPGFAQTLESIQLRQPAVVGGVVTQAEVTLDSPAVDENVWVELAADGPVHVPMAVRIPAGQRSARFVVLTDPTGSEVRIAIRATLRGVGPRLANLQVVPERPTSR
jgi:hypothetical protein